MKEKNPAGFHVDTYTWKNKIKLYFMIVEWNYETVKLGLLTAHFCLVALTEKKPSRPILYT